MILARYLTREILQTTLAVSLVLLLIFISSKFAQYLADAAAGNVSSHIILSLLSFRTPGFVERILPLGFFLGVMLSFGRLYADNEISALQAAGISTGQLFRASALAIGLVTTTVALLSLYLSPAGNQRVEDILNAERGRSEIDMVEAGKFLQLRSGGVVYSADVDAEHSRLRDVFVARQNTDGGWLVIRAETGHRQYDAQSDERYMTLQHGTRYELTPGQASAERLQFGELQQRIPAVMEYDARRLKQDALDTPSLMAADAPAEFRATLQWRLSRIALVPVIALLAIAMSRTSPRQGRFAKLFPAMLLYFFYITSLDVLRNRMAEGHLSAMPGLLPAHAAFLILSLLIFYGDSLTTWLRGRRH